MKKSISSFSLFQIFSFTNARQATQATLGSFLLQSAAAYLYLSRFPWCKQGPSPKKTIPFNILSNKDVSILKKNSKEKIVQTTTTPRTKNFDWSMVWALQLTKKHLIASPQKQCRYNSLSSNSFILNYIIPRLFLFQTQVIVPPIIH